jgi:hypothetical protein
MTHVLPQYSLTWRRSVLCYHVFDFVRKISDERVRGSDDELSGGYALHYKSSYERNFVMRIFVKRELTVYGASNSDKSKGREKQNRIGIERANDDG